MKIKTSELTGIALDWMVAKIDFIPLEEHLAITKWFRPSTDWSQGGPIIEREGIMIAQSGYGWIAALDASDDKEVDGDGLTPLIAAMRCYVATELGEEVEIPEEIACLLTK